MRSEGFSFNFGSLRVELCSWSLFSCPQPFATVRNRPQVFESGSAAPVALPLGRALKSDFSWMCRVAPLVHCDLQKKGNVMQET